MSAASPRRNASPYARRLARERGLALETLAGSGPNGRIVAADVVAFKAPAVPATLPVAVAEPPPVAVAPPKPARLVGAFQALADLKPLTALIAASEAGLGIDPFLVKAAARAAGRHGAAIRFIDAAGEARLVSDAAALVPSEIERRRSAEDGPATMHLTCLAATGIRPVAASLAEDAALKLVVIADAEEASLLLVHDESVIAPSEAVAILSAFRGFIAAPLRLLV